MLIGMAVELNTNPTTPVQPGASSPSQTGFVLKQLPFKVGHAQQAAFPRIRLWDSTSGNWSGYAVPYEGKGVSDTFSDVSGSWVVTPLKAGGRSAAYAATWVGIDGYTSGTVEQIGTMQEWTGRTAQYYAWFEMYPGPMYQIQNAVAVGDVISASVQYAGTTSVKVSRGKTQTEYVFLLSITDTSSTGKVKWGGTVNTSYTTVASADRNSAEWVVEAPSTSSGVLPLADFGTAILAGCTATSLGSGGAAVPVDFWTPDPLTMIEANGTAEAVPSGLVDSASGSAFTVTWDAP